MDLLKEARAQVSGGSSSTHQHSKNAASNTNTNTNTNTSTSAEGRDYGDKALDLVENHTGHTMSRNTNEKITDGARGAYEKISGKKVDPKYSN